MEIIADHISTEAIYRGDLRRMDQGSLALQMLIVRILTESSLQGICNSFPHFPCSCSCERHDQQPVNVNRMFRIHHLF